MLLSTLRTVARRLQSIPLSPLSRQSAVRRHPATLRRPTSTIPPTHHPLSLGSNTFILPAPNSLDHHNFGYHTLGYHITGDPSGTPIFYFHGLPASRLQAAEFHATAAALHICLIGVDRPGIGLSTHQPAYTLLDWPADIQKLASHLRLPTFRVLGASGGGPYALACAYALPPDVLLATGVLAGVAPPEAGNKGRSVLRRVSFAVNRHTPSWLLAALLETSFARHARDADPARWQRLVLSGMVDALPEADRALFDEEARRAVVRQVRDACKSGVGGYVMDAKAVLGGWGFELGYVAGKVRIWNGDRDGDTPVEGARWMVERLRWGSLRVFEGEGHESVFFRGQGEVLRELVEL